MDSSMQISLWIVGVLFVIAFLMKKIDQFRKRRCVDAELEGDDGLQVDDEDAEGALMIEKDPLKALGFSDNSELLTVLNNDSFILDMLTLFETDDDFISAIVSVYDNQGTILELLDLVLEKEVKMTKSESVLFRENTAGTKIIKVLNVRYARGFLKESVGGLIESIINRNESYEVFPEKVSSEAELAENFEKLYQLSDNLFEVLVNSIDDCPRVIRDMYSILYNNIQTRYPDSAERVVRSMFMLRFVCPSLIIPHLVGISPNTPPDNAKRSLLLSGKVLQALANNVMFGPKEPQLEGFNSFITSKREMFNNFMDQLHTSGGKSISNPPPPTETEINVILKTMMSKSGQVKKILENI